MVAYAEDDNHLIRTPYSERYEQLQRTKVIALCKYRQQRSGLFVTTANHSKGRKTPHSTLRFYITFRGPVFSDLLHILLALQLNCTNSVRSMRLE